MPDVGLINSIVQGGALAAFLWLVIDTRRESAKREETMRSSFIEREQKFLETIQTDSDKFIEALRLEADKFIDALKSNTASLSTMETHLEDSLSEMRRKIDGEG